MNTEGFLLYSTNKQADRMETGANLGCSLTSSLCFFYCETVRVSTLKPIFGCVECLMQLSSWATGKKKDLSIINYACIFQFACVSKFVSAPAIKQMRKIWHRYGINFVVRVVVHRTALLLLYITGLLKVRDSYFRLPLVPCCTALIFLLKAL